MILRIPPFNRFLPGPIAQVSPRGADRSALGLVRRVNGAVVAVPWGGPEGDWPAGDRFSWRLAFVVAAALLAGCSAPSTADKPGKHEQCSLRLHLEVNADGSDRNAPVAVGRESPFVLNVEKKAFLDEFSIEKASVVENFGGFSISVLFNKQGTWLLELYSTAYKGKRIAIAAEFGQTRWLAAPVITHRIADGLIVFTPDATREEAERIVNGLNRVADLVKKGRKG